MGNIQRKLLVVGDGGGSGGSTTGGTINTSSSSTTNNISDEPFFSPAMETELLMLATNFLLYVAMVIIITLVTKLYFPAALKRGDANSDQIHLLLYIVEWMIVVMF